jgi:hypothetical protein
MHNDLSLHITLFQSYDDNAAKSILMPWRDIAAMMSARHASAQSHKSLLPLFSPWRYKDVWDPTISNGRDSDGKPLRHFSDTHVRRIEPNVLEMTMLVLDFDGRVSIEEAKERFPDVELVGYTTLNHQVDGHDKFRIVMPYSSPLPIIEFSLYKEAIREWAFEHGTDKSTADVGRMFILPAVREEHRPLAQCWYQAGTLLDWHMFDSKRKRPAVSVTTNYVPSVRRPTEHKLLPNDVLDTASGPIVVSDINRKISNVRCPFHHDAKPTEFVAVTGRGTPYLVCKKCGTVYMERRVDDGIAAGIARIKARKSALSGGAQ